MRLALASIFKGSAIGLVLGGGIVGVSVWDIQRHADNGASHLVNHGFDSAPLKGCDQTGDFPDREHLDTLSDALADHATGDFTTLVSESSHRSVTVLYNSVNSLYSGEPSPSVPFPEAIETLHSVAGETPICYGQPSNTQHTAENGKPVLVVDRDASPEQQAEQIHNQLTGFPDRLSEWQRKQPPEFKMS